MHWSKYNIICHSSKYGYLLFNTISLSFIQIDDSDIESWRILKFNPNDYKKFEGWEYLYRSRIIVSDNEDDFNVYVTDIMKNRYTPVDVSLTILPTRGCNFGCIYCYEQDRPKINMSEETEHAIVSFLASNAYMKRLSVIWYGGEPLINFPSMQRLTKEFLSMNIEYTARMITNGYLLTKSVAEKLESMRIKNIQITLDGSENIHNKRRMLLNGQPTYRRIVDNLKYLLEVNKNITVNIRTNVDRRNMDDYFEFYENFRSEIDNPRVNLYPGFVSDLLSSECVPMEYNISAGGYKAQFVLDIFNKYGIEFKSFLPKYRRHSCVANKYWAFVIGPEGELYKCWRMVGNKSQEIGNVKNSDVDMYKFSRYMSGTEYTADKKCQECEFITLCGGGCPLQRMRNKYEGTQFDYCCPEKTHMGKLMEMRYEMYLRNLNKGE